MLQAFVDPTRIDLARRIAQHDSPLPADRRWLGYSFGQRFRPLSLEIHYDPNYIDAQDQYRLIASVTSYQGELLLEGFTDLRAPQEASTLQLRCSALK